MCRRVFKTDFARILTHAEATRELSTYNQYQSSISINKVVSFGILPVVGAAAYAHIWKTKPKDLTKHKQAIAATVVLAVLTNIWATYSSAQIPAMEDRLIEKYVWTLDNQTLDNYANRRRFPNAR